MSQIPRKACLFAFALQTQQGTPAALASAVILPLPGAETIQTDPHYEFLRYADDNAYENTYVERGTWAEGDVQVPLIPGSCADLFDWIITRDAYWQGKWATVWSDLVNVQKKWSDVKVARATFRFRTFQEPELTLTLRARKVETGEAIAGSIVVPQPYECKEIEFQVSWNTNTPAADTTIREVTIEIDNMVESGEDGGRITNDVYPVTLDNEMGPVVTGSLSRDFRSSAAYDAWAAGNEGSLKVVMSRGTTTATVFLPRVVWVGNDVGIPDSGFVREGINFRALGSTDGATAPIDLAESTV
ncbi:phage tail tube protein [Pseudomonas sp.]|uniref:phage tail tube protein n=1 Tax=Pseudomonas sp. TaxID=306 RepID=UPI003D0EED5F